MSDSTNNSESYVTCLVCGKDFDKEIAAAWHEDQTGHDEWSDDE